MLSINTQTKTKINCWFLIGSS